MSNVDKNAEILLVNPTSNPGTVNLPLTTTLPYRMLTIKHIGSTSLNGITLAAQGSDSFEDGTTSYVITRQTSFVTFYANASANKWVQVGGTNQFIQQISSLTVNTINGQTYVPVSPTDLVSTSLLTSSLVSTVRGLSNIAVTQIVAGTNITISPVGGQGIVTINASGGGGGSGDVTSTNLTSTTLGLGTLGYISSPPRFLSTNAMFTSSLVVSTISTTNTLFTNALISRSTNLSSVYISDLTAVKSYISSLQVDELILGTGDGWTDTGPLRATYISSLQINTGDLYARSAFLGANSTLNQIRFWGLFGNYNNTILAEVSTGTAVGAQEFLVFKGSSTSDRIRFQTTGDIRFEPQVGAREFSTATALATPTMILQSNLVGINTTSPGTTLDVVGTIRGSIVSTQQIQASSIQTSVASTLTLNVSTLNGGFPNINAATEASLVVTTANSGQSYFSYDARTWILGSGIGGQNHGVGFNGFHWVAGTEGGAYRSADGISWTTTSLASACSTPAWNGSVWVLAGYYNSMYYSFDGATWFTSPQGYNNTVWQVAWGGDKFVAAAYQAVLYSYDGIYWTNLGNILGGDHTYCVAYNGSYWVIGGRYGSSQIARSVDGINWVRYSASYDPMDFAWNGSIWVAATTNATNMLTSTDGITWTARTNANYLDLGTGSVTWNGTYFYAASGNSTIYISRSKDGISWEAFGTIPGSSQLRMIRARIPLPLNSAKQQYGVYSPNVFLGISTGTTLARFPGPNALYENTLFGEVSTSRFAHEFLVFKGSTIQDRVRIQTTGEIRLEAGVTSRSLKSLSSLPFLSTVAVPAFLVSTNSNVGLGTAFPETRLDVAGTGRFQTVSTLQLSISSINGSLYTTPSFSNLVSTPFLDSTLQSTTGRLQSNIEAWSQYQATNDITLSNGTGIRMVDPNASLQLKTNSLSIQDINGGYGSISMGEAISFLTSSSSESYGIGFSSNVTGTISSFTMTRGDGISFTTASLYISSLYFGNFGGTTSGQLTTDATATDLFWKGSKLNNQSGGGGGGGGAIDYVSAFTVSTNYINVSTLSSYVVECYGVIGTAIVNPGPDNMSLFSVPDFYIVGLSNLALNPTNDLILSTTTSTIVDTGAFYVTSPNDSFINGNLTLNNLMCYNTVSTYTLAVYGSNTLVVDGTSIFKSNVTIDAEMTSRKKFVVSTLGVDDMYIEVADIDKTFLLNGSNSPQNIQLPSAASCGNGWSVAINYQPNNFGTLTIYFDGSNALVPSQYPGATVTCITDGSTWYAY